MERNPRFQLLNDPKFAEKLEYLSVIDLVPIDIDFLPDDQLIKVIHRRIPNNNSGIYLKFQGKFNSDEVYPQRPMILPPYIRDYNISYAIFEDVYVSRSPAVITPDFRLVLTDIQWLPHIKGYAVGEVVYAFEKAIAPGHSFCDNFGHFHIDFFSILIDQPEEVLQNYYILNVPKGNFVQLALDLIEIPREHRIPLMKEYQLAYCKQLIYPFYPLVHQNYTGEPLSKIHRLYHKHFGLDKINPTKNAIINRKETRIWFNAAELLKAIQKAYPRHKWEEISDVFDLTESAKIYASIKFLMTPSGSNLFHCFLMKKDSIILTVEGNVHDWSSIAAIMRCHIHHIIFQSDKLNHVEGFPGFNVDVKKFVHAVGFGVKYLETGKFPDEDLTFDNI